MEATITIDPGVFVRFITRAAAWAVKNTPEQAEPEREAH